MRAPSSPTRGVLLIQVQVGIKIIPCHDFHGPVCCSPLLLSNLYYSGFYFIKVIGVRGMCFKSGTLVSQGKVLVPGTGVTWRPKKVCLMTL